MGRGIGVGDAVNPEERRPLTDATHHLDGILVKGVKNQPDSAVGAVDVVEMLNDGVSVVEVDAMPLERESGLANNSIERILLIVPDREGIVDNAVAAEKRGEMAEVVIDIVEEILSTKRYREVVFDHLIVDQ